MKDGYNRTIDYLRISVTDRCNMRCRYCMPREGIPIKPSEEILSYEEILFIVKAGLPLGINRLRITGGEPLVRRGLLEFIGRLSALPLADLSMTTNGFSLPEMARDLMDAGIKRINISLDTLRRDRFLKLTGVDGFHRVWEGIMKALALGFSPVKLNVVILKDFNEDEILDFVQLSQEYPLEVRFIEWMPLGDGKEEDDYYVSNEEIRERIIQNHEIFKAEGSGSGPAELFLQSGSKGKVGFISPLSCNFCKLCNRLRLTSEGEIRPCLASDREYDLKALLRGGATLLEVQRRLEEIITYKPSGHSFFSQRVAKSMFKIGG